MLDQPRRRSSQFRTLVRQLFQFAIVGGFGFVVDVGIFNLLRAHPPAGLADQWPIIAKCISVLAAIAVNWMGNRWWTFRESRRRNTAREAFEFLIASLIGSGVSLLCLWISHYVLDLRSVLADNISANFIGLALGSVVRFAAYRWWVFADHRNEPAVPEVPPAPATPAAQ